MHERDRRESQEGCGPGRYPEILTLSTICGGLAPIPAAGTCEKIASDLWLGCDFCPVFHFQAPLKTSNS